MKGRRKILIPTTLAPGQYVATSHDMPLVYVYDSDHRPIRAVHLPGFMGNLPAVPKGSPVEIEVACEPLEPAHVPEVRVNLGVVHELLEPRLLKSGGRWKK